MVNVPSKDGVVKIHTKLIQGVDLEMLDTIWSLPKVESLDIKRSGTGLTVIVTVNE